MKINVVGKKWIDLLFEWLKVRNFLEQEKSCEFLFNGL